MSASDHVSQAQSGRYQFHREDDFGETHYRIYRDDRRVGRMTISHGDDDDWDEYSGGYGQSREHKVALLQMVKGHSAAGMLALGVAHNVASDEGVKLTHDSSLSHYSSRLVQNAQRRGLVTEDRPNAQTNMVAHMLPAEEPSHYKPGERIRTDEVNAGRRTIRKMVKQGRPKK